MNKEKEQELREQYKDRGELTVNFILFAYDHYGELLDFSDTYVENQNEETILDIKDYCRVKVVPRVFMLQPGTFSYNIIERAIDFVDRLREKRKMLQYYQKNQYILIIGLIWYFIVKNTIISILVSQIILYRERLRVKNVTERIEPDQKG